MPNGQECGNCHFFRDYQCHRSAPVAKTRQWASTEYVYDNDGKQIMVPIVVQDTPEVAWPQTSWNAWCGEWVKKIEEE